MLPFFAVTRGACGGSAGGIVRAADPLAAAERSPDGADVPDTGLLVFEEAAFAIVCKLITPELSACRWNLHDGEAGALDGGAMADGGLTVD
jgi:hypothetical protein